MNKRDVLEKKVLQVVQSLSELLVLVDNDQMSLSIFEENLKLTGALPCSLDDFVAEWQTVANNISLDVLALYHAWKTSVKFYKDTPGTLKEKACLEDSGLKSDDLVFEDGSYISTGAAWDNGMYILKFYVEIGRDCESFKNFDEAAQYLWDNHSKCGYGA